METNKANVDPGTLLAGRYRVGALLRRECGGSLFVATDLRTGTAVAVKLQDGEIETDDAGPNDEPSDGRAHLRREAAILERIHSRHVPRILDLVEDPEHGLGLVLEPLAGESLLDRLRREGPISIEKLHPLIDQAWVGLGDVHEAGVIYRHIKPSNLFLQAGPGGPTRVKLLDFGVSRLHAAGDETVTLTRMGQSPGMFSFMPPEQIGRAKKVDHRADIYACGTLIFQALSGQLPYLARNVLVLVEAKTKTDARRLGEVMGESVSAGLDAFVARALERAPGARFQTAAEALAAWRALA
jgi:serine/threonine protein kinase